jgi:hypothetical protein
MQGVTNGVVAIQAVAAGVAGDMVGDEDPVTDFVLFHPLADFYDLSRDLVPQHYGSFLDTIPFHHVAAADAAGDHFHQQLA